MVQFLSVLCILIAVIKLVNGFNISPKPNVLLKEPKVQPFLDKSSYFGFSINLRKSSIIIGAPRAQTSQKVNETGAIYKCNFDGGCLPYIFDQSDNIISKSDFKSFDSELKDYQWLGASIDGGSRDNDSLVVCAPRLRSLLKDYIKAERDIMHGVCYWTSNTETDTPQNVEKIVPLKFREFQTIQYGKSVTPFHIFGEQGISVHIPNNNEEVIIGAPGILCWMGSIVRYHFNKMENIRGKLQHKTEIPRPDLWDQEEYSYMGFSVSSGYFDHSRSNKIMYIASAPRTVKSHFGEAYIFDVVTNGRNHTIKKYHSFLGTQFGEYFGYAVLGEDLNNDGLSDVVITAPLHSTKEIVERGAVYVFINNGSFVFELQSKIISPDPRKSRFGITISKLGDINGDGFNDIAIGAPFSDDGAVFIYLGSSKGLRGKYSQKLEAIPITNPTLSNPQMFGYGLSKGCDIDSNNFNDFAIGAPNSESVFVYLAYPVLKINANIKTNTREIKRKQTNLQFTICYSISTKSTKDHELQITVIVDPITKRVILTETGTNQLKFNSLASTVEQCRTLNAIVTPKNIFKRIEITMQYDIVNKIRDSEKFCENCSAVDPEDQNFTTESIIYNHDCISEICNVDLKVTSSDLPSKFILGSDKIITVTYNVTNLGDTAYLPQIQIKSSNKIPFAKRPSSCLIQYDDSLICDLNQKDEKLPHAGNDIITVVYDIAKLKTTKIQLFAFAFSTGKEANYSDNYVSSIIDLQEFTNIEITGKPETESFTISEDSLGSKEIVNNFIIKSIGPSRIQEMEIILEMPFGYAFDESYHQILIDTETIFVEGIYDGQLLIDENFHNKNIYPTNLSAIADASAILDLENNADDEPLHMELLRRRRNSIETESYITKNKSVLPTGDDLLTSLPPQRTLNFSCFNPNIVSCARPIIKVHNFEPNIPIIIKLKYRISLDVLNEYLMDPFEYFVIIPNIEIFKVGDKDRKTTKITKKIEYVLITKPAQKFPLWMILQAAIGGLILLLTITYTLYKAGFFERKIKEEMIKLKQEDGINYEELFDMILLRDENCLREETLNDEEEKPLQMEDEQES